MGATGVPRLESGGAERARTISELDDIDELVRQHQARIRRFAAYSTGDPDLAESITQDTLLRAFRGRDKFRGDCSVSTWLTGIAINVIRDHLRSNRFKFWRQVQAKGVDAQEMASFLPSDAVSQERRMLAQERVKRLYEVLETLSENQRTVFLLKFSEELSVDEISAILGMAVNTVRTHLHRALKAVRGRVGEGI
ncbi:sigma-70 family RNA polymerase sigma factor [Acidobacteria bacterium AB60]|nr:sigma-70 family RNA polymerase sigma factor [Acidobacteria bacterium AB60]